MKAPKPRNGLGVHQFENTLFPIRPLNVPRTVVPVLQQFQQEFPQVCRRTLRINGLIKRAQKNRQKESFTRRRLLSARPAAVQLLSATPLRLGSAHSQYTQLYSCRDCNATKAHILDKTSIVHSGKGESNISDESLYVGYTK